MRLEDIGFYTLSDARAREASLTTPLWRCEMLLTDRCNFSCPYCRGPNQWTAGTMTFEEARAVVDMWADGGLKNSRFSGGEPTTVPYLVDLVQHARARGIERVALSTNGSASRELYTQLLDARANDFSVSLDACCAATGSTMAGKADVWSNVIENIRFLAGETYVTVGVVLTDDNFEELADIIRLAAGLGVADIRIISAAQWNDEQKFRELFEHDRVLDEYDILRYRVENFRNGRNVRGITEHDCHTCWLAVDDMVVAGGYHFPCVIAMREGAAPIGTVAGKTVDEIRQERLEWLTGHNTFADHRCRQNCLDVCIDYNNTAAETHSVQYTETAIG